MAATITSFPRKKSKRLIKRMRDVTHLRAAFRRCHSDPAFRALFVTTARKVLAANDNDRRKPAPSKGDAA